MVDIILIEPMVPKNVLGTITPWDIPSLALGYIAASLESHNRKVAIIDASIERLSIKSLVKRIMSIDPDIKYIGLTGNVYSAKFSLYTARMLKQHFPNTTFIMGGAYATTMHEFVLRNNFVNICVLGEGEFTLPELLDTLDNHEDLEKVKGISFLKEEELITTPRRPYIEDLDSLPFPSWHLFPDLRKYKNLRGVLKRPYLPIFTTRGCPYGCIWCNKNIHGYRVRARSAENVVEEIKRDVKEFGVKEITVMDDNFTFDEIRALKICYLILKERLNISINLYSGVRADKLSPLLLKFLKYVGVHRITVGIESGNQEVVYKIGKNLNLETVRSSLELAQSMGFITDGFFILGLPYDTPKTMADTLNFSKSVALDHAYYFTATPFPGSKLYEIVKEEGHIFMDFKLGIPQHIVEGQAHYEIWDLKKNMIEYYFKLAYKSYYFRLKKIIELAKIYLGFVVKHRSLSEIIWLIQQFLFLL
jgi:anaerobic magnesium-protoporphyrin IX monomethyl ester cyclase